MGKYAEFNIIPLGDHCAIPLILKKLNLRKKGYPFDWVSKGPSAELQLYDLNIIYNIELINELYCSDNIDDIVLKYIGDMCESKNKTNTSNNIWFPHDSNENKKELLDKYKRKFVRLKEDLNTKTIFILLTRQYYIEKDKFQKIMEQLLSYNDESIILFISGTNHPYFENINNDNVIFKYIEYDSARYLLHPDISQNLDEANILKYLDETIFRPNISKYLHEFFI